MTFEEARDTVKSLGIGLRLTCRKAHEDYILSLEGRDRYGWIEVVEVDSPEEAVDYAHAFANDVPF